jgi:hypothetical protein
MTVLSCCIGSSLNSLSHHHVHIRVLGSNEPARGNKDNDEVFCVLLEPENFSVAGDSLHGVDPGGRSVKGCSVEVFYYFAVLEILKDNTIIGIFEDINFHRYPCLRVSRFLSAPDDKKIPPLASAASVGVPVAPGHQISGSTEAVKYQGCR